jgi:hypothetical protein
MDTIYYVILGVVVVGLAVYFVMSKKKGGSQKPGSGSPVPPQM